MIEKGERNLSLLNVERFAKAFDLTPSQLLKKLSNLINQKIRELIMPSRLISTCSDGSIIEYDTGKFDD